MPRTARIAFPATVYLLECGRYIERNPLRAGMAKDPNEYPWSSYSVYAYGKKDGLTDTHEIYEAIGKEDHTRQKAYRKYVCSDRDKEEQELRERMGRGVIGSKMFQEKVEKRAIQCRRPGRGRPRK